MPAMGSRWDIFCRVVDNYGDIGVCWRLARQLVAEHGCAVRLFVDDLHAFRYLAPEIDPAQPEQALLGVRVLHWPLAETLAPAEVVIEAFACDPPAAYVAAMAARAPKPVWLNLEYLSAEAWVDDVHGRPSPHPRLPLVKYFFCPGFTERSGGLIREAGVAGADCADSLPFKGRARVGMGFASTERHSTQPHPAPNLPVEGGGTKTLHLFAFAYPQAPVRAVADALAQAGYSVEVGAAAPFADRDTGWRTIEPVPQPDFDALLAGYDLLIVRGEDSFVRAQWAGKPMLWHIYATDDGAHLVKLDAWLDRYCAGLVRDPANAWRAASHAFVRGASDPGAYAGLTAHLPALAAHALHWRDCLRTQSDLATRLTRFIALAKTQKVG